MKRLSSKARVEAFTLIEVLVVIVIVFVLGAMLLPRLAGSHKSVLVACLNNLKQIDLGFSLYASDSRGEYPMQVSVTSGGTMEFIYSDHVFPHFQKLSRYLPQPQTLVCPLDKSRQAATSYEALNDLNISYFLNADASTNNPATTILVGDRSLQANGQTVKAGLFILTTNSNLSWTPDLHLGRGCLAFADGHVQSYLSKSLNAIVQQQPLATNRLVVP